MPIADEISADRLGSVLNPSIYVALAQADDAEVYLAVDSRNWTRTEQECDQITDFEITFATNRRRTRSQDGPLALGIAS